MVLMPKRCQRAYVRNGWIGQIVSSAHAAQYPQLTADIGNIALLKLCGDLDLIDAALAGQVADAYRRYHKMQHQIMLNEQ
jgi:glutamate-ammonia-ligase adenylyltransferase